jgi:protein tyrosine/serine phosphatase
MTFRPLGVFDATAPDRPHRSGTVKRLMRCIKITGICVGLLAASIGGYWGFLQYEGNLHTVRAGILYRSAQLNGEEIKSAVGKYGIKSVLNLRGAHKGEPWYDDEMAASGALSLAHFDYPISAKRFVTGQQITEILEIVRKAPKPLLVHCKSGADRAGLVAALYRYSQTGASAEQADGELSLVYGHFPYLTSQSGAMDDSFWAFVHGAPQTVTR